MYYLKAKVLSSDKMDNLLSKNNAILWYSDEVTDVANSGTEIKACITCNLFVR